SISTGSTGSRTSRWSSAVMGWRAARPRGTSCGSWRVCSAAAGMAWRSTTVAVAAKAIAGAGATTPGGPTNRRWWGAPWARGQRPIVIVAYSLGGNIVGSWLGRHAETVPPQVRAAFCCSLPFLLAPCSREIERGVQRFYLRHFLGTLRQKAARKATVHPGAFDARAATTARSLREFDEAFTCRLHGFRDVDEYYANASCGPHLARIRVPTLLLN